MIRNLYTLHIQSNPQIYQVRSSLSSVFSLLTIKHHFFTTTESLQDPKSSSIQSYTEQTHNTHIEECPNRFSSIAKSVISTFEKKKNELGFSCFSLRDLLLKVSDFSPETTRRFRRVSELKPEDVLELLLGFLLHCENFGFETRKIEVLWEVFKWVINQNTDFKHIPRSYEVMASMLIRVGLFRDVEIVLSTMESQGISLDSIEIFSKLIEGYVGDLQLEKAILVYNRMRGQHLAPSLSCYRVLLNLLVRRNETQLAFRVCMDMVEMRVDLTNGEKGSFENVVRLLCRDGKIQEARNLVKRGLDFGLNPSSLVLNEIANGYCEKKDFEDALKFFTEVKRPPDVLAGNKILFSLCSNFSTERAHFAMQKLVHLGFIPDETTFGILIGWSCFDGELRDAFYYLSEILSRGLKPDVYSYNALISGLFNEGMWMHAKDVFIEMTDIGISPNMSTFKVLLAGYCQARQFDEAKAMVSEMENHGLIELSSLDDPLSKAFMVLGLNSLAVRVKRDNHVRLVNTEFFDNLGNGLYLDTDVDEYEKTVEGVLKDSMIPDFNSLVVRECGTGNSRVALMMVDEMVRWGQELSSSTFSALVKELYASRRHIKEITYILEKMPKLAYQLDQELLNFLVQACSKKGLTYNGRRMADGMLKRHLKIKNETYTALVMGICRKGELKDFRGFWDLARKENWLPGFEDCKALVECLCRQKLLKEALELLEIMLATYPQSILDICNIFVENLCATGDTSLARALTEKVQQQGCILNQMVYSHLIKGFLKERKFSEAFIAFDAMLAKNLAPSLDISVLLIPQLCRADRIKQALALKEICLREHSLASLSVYTALVSGFCKAGEVGEAVNLVRDLLSKGLLPDPETFNMLVQGYCQAKNLSKVEELLGVMIAKNVSLSVSSYRKLVHLMCAKGRVLQALSVKELMLIESNSSHLIIAYNILIFYLFQTGNSSLVNTVLDELQQKGVLFDQVTYNFVVYGFCQNRDVPSSLQYLNTMISKEFRPSNRSLRAVISCLCHNGELEKAFGFGQEMELRGWVHGSSVQNSIAESLLFRGKLQEAEKYLDRMIEKGLIPKSINYDNLIKRFVEYGRLNKAVDLLNVMLMKGNIPNSGSYDSIICGFCSFNKLDRAMDFHIEMLDRNLEPSLKTWYVLVENFCKCGRTAEAENLLSSMIQIGETPTREIYCSLINRYRLENNLSKLSELFQEMQKYGYDPDFETHWSLISNLSSSNEEEDNGSSSPGLGFLSKLLSDSGFSRKKRFQS